MLVVPPLVFVYDQVYSLDEWSIPVMPVVIVKCLWEVMHDIGIKEVWEFLDCASSE